jgi:hypothetical protein
MIQHDAQNLRIRPDVGVPLPAHLLPFPLPVAKTTEVEARSIKMYRVWYIEVGAKV